jgi:two-component system, cell cycle response regulator CpdR
MNWLMLPPGACMERPSAIHICGPRHRLKLANPMTIKILLAEDDTDMRRFLVKALQTAGYQVISYDNGLSAYQRLREEPFELLLTDIVMPEMDGIELARRASELDPDMKIMFITGFAAVALNPDSSAPKQAKVLSKPFHLRELVSEVGKMLAA